MDALTIKSEPTFPVPADIEGIKVVLHADGTAEGDADALAARLSELRGPAHQGSLLAWQVMAVLRATTPPAATADRTATAAPGARRAGARKAQAR